MDNLIKITMRDFNGENEQSINARDLHEFMEVKTKYQDWIKDRINKSQLLQGVEYQCFTETRVKPQGGRPATEYILTVDAGKHIAMLEGNEKGRQVRQYFIQVEKEVRRMYMRAAATPKLLPTLEQEASGVMAGWLQAAQLLDVPKHLAQTEATKAVKSKTGIDYSPLLLMSPSQNLIAGKEEALEPADIGKHVGLEGSEQKRGRAVNAFLCEIGLQDKINGQWVPTEKGKNLAFRHQWNRGSKSGYNYKWNFLEIKKFWSQTHK